MQIDAFSSVNPSPGEGGWQGTDLEEPVPHRAGTAASGERGPTLVRALRCPSLPSHGFLRGVTGNQGGQAQGPAPHPDIRVGGGQKRLSSDGKNGTVVVLICSGFLEIHSSVRNAQFPQADNIPQQLIRTFHTARAGDIYICYF